MRSFIKYALVGTALAASAGAYADATLPSTGNGQAVLFVKNDTTGAVYARAFTLTMNDIATQAAIVGDTYTGGPSLAAADTSLSFNLASPLNPDANLTGFLNGTDSFSWTVLVGDSLSGASQGLLPGERRFAFANSTGGSAPFNSQINTQYGNLNSWLTTLNGTLGGAAGTDSSTAINGVWGTVSGSQNWAGAGPSTVNALGTTAGFFLVTSNGTSATDASSTTRVYRLGDLQLTTAGVLQSIGGSTPEVPLPPALWLLGSALAGFAGMRRNREGVAISA